MMRTRQFIAIFLLVGGLFTINNPLWAQANAQPNQADVELVIWTYDSFMSEWGPAGQIAEAFQKAYGAKLRFVSKGDGGALLSALLDGSRKPNADIIIGLDNRQLKKDSAERTFCPTLPEEPRRGAEESPARSHEQAGPLRFRPICFYVGFRERHRASPLFGGPHQAHLSQENHHHGPENLDSRLGIPGVDGGRL